jgi:hypothetical protein
LAENQNEALGRSRFAFGRIMSAPGTKALARWRDHEGGSTDLGVRRNTCCAVAAVVQEMERTQNTWVAAKASAALQTAA